MLSKFHKLFISILFNVLVSLTLSMERENNHIANKSFQITQEMANKLSLKDAKELICQVKELPYDMHNVIQDFLMEKNNLLFIDLFKTCKQLNDDSKKNSAFDISSNGQFILTGSNDSIVRIWYLNDFQNINNTSKILGEHTGEILSVAISKDCKFALTGSADKTIKLWELSHHNNIQFITLAGQADAITALAISSDNKFALSGSKNGEIILWDLSDLNKITSRVIGNHSYEIKSILINFNNRFALTSDLNVDKIWNLADLNNISHKILEGEEGLSFSADGRFAITGSYNNNYNANFWNLSDWQNVTNISMDVRHTGLHASAFSPKVDLIATGGAACVYLWKLIDINGTITILKIDEKLLVHPDAHIRTLEFSHDGQFILVGFRHQSPRLYNLNELTEVEQIVLNDDRRLIKYKAYVGIKLGDESKVHQARFSPNGKYIITRSFAGNITVWDIKPKLTFEQIALIAKLKYLEENKVDVSFVLKDRFFADIFETFTQDQKEAIKKRFKLS